MPQLSQDLEVLRKELAGCMEARDDDLFIADAELLPREGIALLHECIMGLWRHTTKQFACMAEEPCSIDPAWCSLPSASFLRR